jgi:hypothetical protein
MISRKKKGPGESRAFGTSAGDSGNDYGVFTDARRNGTRPVLGRQQAHPDPHSVGNIYY